MRCESDARAEAGLNCAANAVSSAGKPLAGAARTSFMKKCEAQASATAPGCEARALSSSGKPLAGAAKVSFVTKCEADARAAR